jgi:hypothetical protein
MSRMVCWKGWSSTGSLICAFLALLFLMLSASVSAFCETDIGCPWLNAATAAGFLQGPVVTTLMHTTRNKDDVTCKFVRRNGHIVSGLQIKVETMKDSAHEFGAYTAQCGSDTAPLRAIGNEALVCSLHEKKSHISEEVVGRVRDRVFIVRMSSNDHSTSQGALREAARGISEQVAGILF